MREERNNVAFVERRNEEYLEYLKGKIVTPDLLDEIADKIADKIIDRVEVDMTTKVAANLRTMAYAAVGQTVVEKIFYFIGIITVALATYLHFKGMI
jgi:hypothetical protein